MVFEELKKFVQNDFIKDLSPKLRGGVCYYLCEFMDVHVLSPWRDVRTFRQARVNVENMSFAAMLNYARSTGFEASLANSRITQTSASQYGIISPSESNTLYRAHTVFIGMSGAAEVDEHAALLLTGDNAGIIFEPNFGFYKFTKQPTEKYEDCFESIIDDLYIINRIHSMTFRKSRTLKT